MTLLSGRDSKPKKPAPKGLKCPEGHVANLPTDSPRWFRCKQGHEVRVPR